MKIQSLSKEVSFSDSPWSLEDVAILGLFKARNFNYNTGLHEASSKVTCSAVSPPPYVKGNLSPLPASSGDEGPRVCSRSSREVAITPALRLRLVASNAVPTVPSTHFLLEAELELVPPFYLIRESTPTFLFAKVTLDKHVPWQCFVTTFLETRDAH